MVVVVCRIRQMRYSVSTHDDKATPFREVLLSPHGEGERKGSLKNACLHLNLAGGRAYLFGHPILSKHKYKDKKVM